MKKVYYLILSVMILSVISLPPAEAVKNKEKSATVQAEKDIRKVFTKQIELTNKKDFDGLKGYYSDNYRNSDFFDKNTTFALIKENYELYPDLKITFKINSIDINDDYAVADVYECATADNLKRDELDYKGKLKAEGRTLYYLENINDKWLITSEKSVYESNIISFGETDYMDVKLAVPMSVPVGEQYNASLKINNIPSTAVVIGSIEKSEAIYPIPVEDDNADSYRIFEDTSLERILTANRDNINEYVSGTVGITRSKPLPNGDIKLYLSGMAFVMTKVNIIPENKKYTPAPATVEIQNKKPFVEANEPIEPIEPDDILPNDNIESEYFND